ncbi:MAG: hypothetical protein Kow00109_12890 [Acidobacteriota bacterium]
MRRLLLGIFVVLTPVVLGQTQRRDPLEYIRILESAERVRNLQVDRVVQSLNLEPGSIVADLGAGSGLFTRPMARLVGPEGVVYAVDIDPELLEHIQETAREQNLTNIRTVLAGEFDARLPERVDFVLICDTLHEIRRKPEYLQGLTRYLKPGARVAVIDYLDPWPERLANERYTLEDLDAWMAAAGLTREKEFKFLENNFFRIYRFGRISAGIP